MGKSSNDRTYSPTNTDSRQLHQSSVTMEDDAIYAGGNVTIDSSEVSIAAIEATTKAVQAISDDNADTAQKAVEEARKMAEAATEAAEKMTEKATKAMADAVKTSNATAQASAAAMQQTAEKAMEEARRANEIVSEAVENVAAMAITSNENVTKAALSSNQAGFNGLLRAIEKNQEEDRRENEENLKFLGETVQQSLSSSVGGMVEAQQETLIYLVGILAVMAVLVVAATKVEW